MHIIKRLALGATLAVLAACGKTPETAAVKGAGQEQAKKERKETGEHQEGHEEKKQGEAQGADEVRLSEAQMAAAGIEVRQVEAGSADTIEAAAIIEADPARSHSVAIAVGGRIAALHRQPGDPVRRGEPLAEIESAQAAEMKAELESARRQAELSRVALEREERLYHEKVSAGQDVLAARAAAGEANTRLRLAQQRLAAIGAGNAGGGPLNRVVLRAPAAGHVLARSAVVGSIVAADTELYRTADLSRLAVKMVLSPDDASRVAAGQAVQVSAGARTGSARIVYVSPVIDPATRQVQALAALPNPGIKWRVGETARASIAVERAPGAGSPATLAVPRDAIQTVEDKPTVFVRTDDGFAARHVVLGPSSGTEVAVLSGLAAGERIAVANSYVLKAELAKGEGGGEHHH